MVKMTQARRAQAEADVGRPAAARGGRPGAGQPPERAVARRAAGRPRPQAARGDADRAEAAPEPARHHVHVRHPRPGRSDGHERSHRDHARRPHRTTRRSRTRCTSGRRGVRRRLHRPQNFWRGDSTATGDVVPADGVTVLAGEPRERAWSRATTPSPWCDPRAIMLPRSARERRATMVPARSPVSRTSATRCSSWSDAAHATLIVLLPRRRARVDMGDDGVVPLGKRRRVLVPGRPSDLFSPTQPTEAPHAGQLKQSIHANRIETTRMNPSEIPGSARPSQRVVLATSCAGAACGRCCLDVGERATCRLQPTTHGAQRRPATPAGQHRPRRREPLTCTPGVSTTTPSWSSSSPTTIGVTMNVDYYDSNEELIAKLEAGKGTAGYDIVVPTGPYIPQMIEQGAAAEARQVEDPELGQHRPALPRPAWDPGNEFGGARTGARPVGSTTPAVIDGEHHHVERLHRGAQGRASGKMSMLDTPDNVAASYFWANGIDWTTEEEGRPRRVRGVPGRRVRAAHQGVRLLSARRRREGAYVLSMAWNGDARQGTSDRRRR